MRKEKSISLLENTNLVANVESGWGVQGIVDKTFWVAIEKGWQNLKMRVKKSTWVPSNRS